MGASVSIIECLGAFPELRSEIETLYKELKEQGMTEDEIEMTIKEKFGPKLTTGDLQSLYEAQAGYLREYEKELKLPIPRSGIKKNCL